MNKKEVDEIIACLPRGITEFNYTKDQYALELLARKAGKGKSISEIKKTSYGSLLNKQTVKTRLAKAGAGRICACDLGADMPQDSLAFVLTLASWGGVNGDYQTSRQGFNLVLQLNFSAEHHTQYYKIVKPCQDALFNYRGHPVLRKGQRELFYETLAWSRIDLDFFTGIALIEEIQTDWIREAFGAYMARMRFRHKSSGRYWAKRMQCNRATLSRYIEEILNPYTKVWAEAMLTASIRFIVDELGIRTIYYHSYETGAAIKDIASLPPRSLYSDLPRRFCFEKTAFAPGFIVNNNTLKRMRTVKNPHWYRLQV